MPTSMIGTTGTDEYGLAMVTTLAAEGIDLSHFWTTEGPTAVAYMDMIGNDRLHVRYDEGVMEGVQYSDEDIAFAASHDLVHSAPWGHVEAHLERIRHARVPISFDYSTYCADPVMGRTLPLIDYAFFSFPQRDSEAETCLRRAVECGVRVAVATLGEHGSLAWDGRDWSAFGIYEAHVVNTIGAGDAFIAGFMHCTLLGGSVDESLDEGARLAASVVGVFEPWSR